MFGGILSSNIRTFKPAHERLARRKTMDCELDPFIITLGNNIRQGFFIVAVPYPCRQAWSIRKVAGPFALFGGNNPRSL